MSIYKYSYFKGLLAQVKVSVTFSSISWTRFLEETEEHKFGMIIGGHPDGSVSLWDVTSILQNKEGKLKVNFGLAQSKKFHTSPVTTIKFNQKPSLFATGSTEIIIVSIDKNLNMESAVKCPSQDDGIITSLSWNDKVAHILASATSTGMVYIWEMKKCELYLTIADQYLNQEVDDYNKREFINTQTIWCFDGVQLIISYDHPEYTFLTQYHMKQPNAPSAEYHGGHSKSIYSLSKNINDTNFYLSLGRDNIVTCWSMRTQKPLSQIQLQEKASSIIWMNKTPDCFVSVGLDGNLYHHQVNFTQDTSTISSDALELPPKWLIKKTGVNFAFGGKFATFAEKFQSLISIHGIVGNVDLTNKIKSFIEKIEKSDLSEILEEKINSSKDKNVGLMWVALKSHFTSNFNELFRIMGYDKSKLQNEVFNYIGKKVQKETKKREVQRNINLVQNNDNDAFDFWNEVTAKNEPTPLAQKDPQLSAGSSAHKEPTPNEKAATITETISKNTNWNLGPEKLIKQSLLIGDLESAVDVALKSGRDAEALLIASAGDKDLFSKAKAAFFNKNRDLFIKNIFSSIINKNFETLLDYNVLKEWKEYILYAKTYLPQDKFVVFANSIADKLAASHEVYTAIVCYILGENYEKCIDLLYTNYIIETEKLNKNDKKFYLHNLFEEVIAIKYTLGYDSPHEKTDKLFYEYCQLLIDEGLFVEACTYLIKIKNNNPKILTLYDRLYNHCDYQLGKQFTKIAPPYNLTVIKAKLEKKLQPQQGGKIGGQQGKNQQNIFEGGNMNIGSNNMNMGMQNMNKPIAKHNPFGQQQIENPIQRGIGKPNPMNTVQQNPLSKKPPKKEEIESSQNQYYENTNSSSLFNQQQNQFGNPVQNQFGNQQNQFGNQQNQFGNPVQNQSFQSQKIQSPVNPLSQNPGANRMNTRPVNPPKPIFNKQPVQEEEQPQMNQMNPLSQMQQNNNYTTPKPSGVNLPKPNQPVNPPKPNIFNSNYLYLLII